MNSTLNSLSGPFYSFFSPTSRNTTKWPVTLRVKSLMQTGILVIFSLFSGMMDAYATTPPSRSLQLTYTCYLTNLPRQARQADIWIPVPIANERQTVTLLTTDLAGGTLTTEPKYGNQMYYRRLDLSQAKQTDTITIKLTYAVRLTEKSVAEARQLTPLPKTPVRPDMQVYLAPNRLIPLHGPIDTLKQKMQLPAAPFWPPANYTTTSSTIWCTITRHQAPGAGIGDAVWACSSKTGPCSDYHSIFIGICRSESIPTDHVFGIPFRASRGVAKSWHCWARYYVEGPGGMTIDAPEADKHPEQRGYATRSAFSKTGTRITLS